MSRTNEQINRSIAIAERAHSEGRTPTHQEMYPEQYSDPIVGQNVHVKNGLADLKGKVVRCFGTQFGQLVEIEGKPKTFYRKSDCNIITD